MKALYTLLILLIPFVGFGQIPSYVAQNGLIGWWQFNQNSLDESGNNLHLNPQGDAMLVEDRFFEENSAYRFTTNDNNSKLLFNNNAFSIINNLSSGSISIWVKINEHNISGHYFQNDNFFIVKQTTGLNTELLLALRGGTTKIRAHLSGPLPNSVFESISELSIGNWHNIVFTWGNGLHKIYIDGVLDNQQNSNVILSNNPNPTYMGIGAVGIGSNTCNSDIDDIGIWNRALNDEEITDLFIYCENTFGTDTQVHCDTYTWIDGNTYTESNNTATFTLTNSNNCDSIVTLDLIINNSDNTSSSVTACDEFTWDGQTYTESGEYTNTYTNANGCDSTHTLNLTINNSISSNTEASSCSTYEWNGMIYENSGNYQFDTIASNGCDSIALLELEICYLDQLEINGPTAAVTSTTSSFSVQDNAGSIYEWSLSNELGEISSGQNSNEINVDWSTDEGLITICVLEKYDCSGLECLGDTVCLEVELKRPAGVFENNLEVNIYPNPSSNIFNLEFNADSETEISVTNILGEQVYFESTKSIGEYNTQIDLSNYSKGIYNLTIKTTDGISNHKLILQ